MKKKKLIIAVSALSILLSACGNAGQEEPLTLETAKKADGYILAEAENVLGLRADGTVKRFNGPAFDEDEMNQVTFDHFDRKKVVELDGCSSEGNYTFRTEDGYIFGGLAPDGMSGVKDIMYTVNNGKDELTCLMEDGTVWSTLYGTDPNQRLSYDQKVKEVRYAYRTMLIMTMEDGTVQVASNDEMLKGLLFVTSDEELAPAVGIGEISQWSDIQLAVSDRDAKEEHGYFAAGLKEDGTVTATGTYADQVADWEDVVYLETSENILAGITSDGSVLLAGTNAEKMESAYAVSEWKNVTAVDFSIFDAMIALTSDGEILGLYQGSKGEKGFGPH